MPLLMGLLVSLLDSASLLARIEEIRDLHMVKGVATVAVIEMAEEALELKDLRAFVKRHR